MRWETGSRTWFSLPTARRERGLLAAGVCRVAEADREARWFDVTCVGWLDYCSAPSRDKVDVVQRIWPDAAWIKNAHAPDKDFKATNGSMPVKYAAWVWGCGGLYDPTASGVGQGAGLLPEGRRAYPRAWAAKEHPINLASPGSAWRSRGPASTTVAAHSAARDYRGHGARQHTRARMVGGDFWPLPMGARGRLEPLCDNKGGVGPRNNTLAMLSPGPDGAVFSERLEALREGVQIAEAIVFLQKALAAKTCGAELSRRIEEHLDERARHQLRNTTPVPCGRARTPCG